MKGIIVYASKTGYTKRYAAWLSEALNFDLISIEDYKSKALEEIKQYKAIIFGGSLYAGGIWGLKEFWKVCDSDISPRAYYYAVGATPIRAETSEEIYRLNFEGKAIARDHFYYFRGGFDFERLGNIDKFLMQMMKLKISLKPEAKRSPDEKGMLRAYSERVDFSRRHQIEALVAKIKRDLSVL